MNQITPDVAPVARALSLSFYALEAHLVKNGALRSGELAATLRLYEPRDDQVSREAAAVLAQIADELDADHFGHGQTGAIGEPGSRQADND